jgi:Holliday junction resolvase
LMHDIHRATAMALPILLKELKANGYHVVHVTAAGERPKSVPELMALPNTDGKVLLTVQTSDSSVTRQSHRIRKTTKASIMQCTRTTQAA